MFNKPRPPKFQFRLGDLIFAVFLIGAMTMLWALLIKDMFGRYENEERAVALAVGVTIQCLFVSLGFIISIRRNHSPVRKRCMVLGCSISALPIILASDPNLHTPRSVTNESAAISTCKAIVEAEDIYRRNDANQDGVADYAQRLLGTNSLYEATAGQADIGLIDRTSAMADFDLPNPVMKCGYYFRILKRQGSHAVGGTKSYVVNGCMIEGFAVIAIPARHPKLGVNTFLFSSSGDIYQKDLGRDSLKIASQITEFDPDPSWVLAE